MNFNGFEVFPMGNASLSISNNALSVTGISDSGLDGIMVQADPNCNCTLNFDTLQGIVEYNGVLNCTVLAKNPFGVVVPVSQSSKWYNGGVDKVIYGYNSKLMPKEFVVMGTLNGNSVFSINSTDINTTPDSNYPDVPESFIWIPVIVAVIGVSGVIFSALHSKHSVTTTVVRDGNGRVIRSTTTTVDDPIPFVVEVNGNTYTVDQVGVEYTSVFPPELVGQECMDI
ncbi:MAG: hypothetical protein JST27_00150 [Bacteroidetes bacterium]|nr:hypothetical protein [Bacteroidota bacterium]